MERKLILEHVDELSAEQLAGFIKQGIVTLPDIKETGLLDASKRAAITNILQVDILKDDEAWEQVRYTNKIIDLLNWINENPVNKHNKEAKERLGVLQEEIENNKRRKQGILDNIRRNPNTYSVTEIRGFLSNRTITEQDLHDYCNIPQSALDNLDNVKAPPLDIGSTPENIPEGFTEVYFWGYKGSGKTCALGAILHVAEKKGYLTISDGPGSKYASNVKNIFSDDGLANDFLPAPTPLESTQYLPFTLQHSNESKSRSVSLIEISGEIFKGFASINQHQSFPSEMVEKTFNSLNVFLKSKNDKIHFFFIDYALKNKPVDGMTQSDYLSNAATYFTNHEIFSKSTKAIYIVLTKSDLMHDEYGDSIPVERRTEYAKRHLNGHNYLAFVKSLKDKCRKFGINGGKLTVEPFSLGKVYFQNICNFEGSAASNIVEILMQRIPVSKKNILDIFNK